LASLTKGRCAIWCRILQRCGHWYETHKPFAFQCGTPVLAAAAARSKTFFVCTTDCSNLQVTAGLLQLNADAGKSSIWHSGQGSVSDGLALAIARHFKTTEERRNVIEKVKLAGMLSTSNPSTLPSCPVLCAPPLSPLPSSLPLVLSFAASANRRGEDWEGDTTGLHLLENRRIEGCMPGSLTH